MLGGVDHTDRVLERVAGEGLLSRLTRMARWAVPASWQPPTPSWFRVPAWDRPPAAASLSHAAAFRAVTDLLPRFFGVDDPAHYARAGAELQSCLVSHAVLAAPASSPPRRGLPAANALGPDDWVHMCGTSGEGKHCLERDVDVPVFCLTSKDGSLAPTNASRGWSAQTGGKENSKRWLRATRAGARLRVDVPMAALAFKVEIYRHHELPLGRISVAAAGLDAPQVIDPCCAAPGCPGIPIGQGTYASVRVPPVGYLPRRTSSLEITVLPKPAPSKCKVGGTQVSLAGVVGLVEEGAQATG